MAAPFLLGSAVRPHPNIESKARIPARVSVLRNPALIKLAKRLAGLGRGGRQRQSPFCSARSIPHRRGDSEQHLRSPGNLPVHIPEIDLPEIPGPRQPETGPIGGSGCGNRGAASDGQQGMAGAFRLARRGRVFEAPVQRHGFERQLGAAACRGTVNGGPNPYRIDLPDLARRSQSERVAPKPAAVTVDLPLNSRRCGKRGTIYRDCRLCAQTSGEGNQNEKDGPHEFPY